MYYILKLSKSTYLASWGLFLIFKRSSHRSALAEKLGVNLEELGLGFRTAMAAVFARATGVVHMTLVQLKIL